jgi:hypothetical protein
MDLFTIIAALIWLSLLAATLVAAIVGIVAKERVMAFAVTL